MPYLQLLAPNQSPKTTKKMTVHTFELFGKVPSKKNSKRRIKRGSHIFMVPSEAHEVWHTEQMLAMRRRWVAPAIPKVKCVILSFYFGDNRGNDLSNKAESVMDLLVDTGVLEDDSWQVVGRLDLRSMGIDKDNPRVKITLDV
jgi:Holliday junction resolvase RusA-like endonuclease